MPRSTRPPAPRTEVNAIMYLPNQTQTLHSVSELATQVFLTCLSRRTSCLSLCVTPRGRCPQAYSELFSFSSTSKFYMSVRDQLRICIRFLGLPQQDTAVPQSGRLPATKVCSLTVLETRSLWSECQWACAPSKGSRRESFLASSQHSLACGFVALILVSVLMWLPPAPHRSVFVSFPLPSLLRTPVTGSGNPGCTLG